MTGGSRIQSRRNRQWHFGKDCAGVRKEITGFPAEKAFAFPGRRMGAEDGKDKQKKSESDAADQEGTWSGGEA